MIDLADILTDINEFLNTCPDDIIQVKEGYLSKKQLEEGRKIVRKNPEIMEHFKYFDKYNDGCDECLRRISCCKIFEVVTSRDLSYCDKYPMFIPERVFYKVKGLKI